MKRLASLSLVALAAAAVGAAQPAKAFPDARIESQLRPNFGLLVRPPLHAHGYYRPWGGHYPGWWRPYAPPPPGGPFPPGFGRDVAYVDCAMVPGPNAVNAALRFLRPGGTLILKAGGAACLDNVIIDKPVTIQSDSGRPFRSMPMQHEGYDPDQRFEGRDAPHWAYDPDDMVSTPPTFKSQPGGPCMVIEVQPGLQGPVILRDLVIQATEAGREACIYARNSDVRIERSVIRYAGDGAAIYVEGGKLTLRDDVRVDANTYQQAIYAENATLDAEDTTITRAFIGVQIIPAGREESRLTHVRFRFMKPGASATFDAPNIGVVVPGSRFAGRLRIDETKICGYQTGLWVQGANDVEVTRSHICRSTKGVIAAGGNTVLNRNSIGANIYGVQIGAGHVTLADNAIYGARVRDVYLEPGAPLPNGGGNFFYSSSEFCSWRPLDKDYWGRERVSHRMRDRYYLPKWRGDWWECRDPYDLEPGWLDGEREMGYGDPEGFYALGRWPDRERMVPQPYDRYPPGGLRDYGGRGGGGYGRGGGDDWDRGGR
jgi:hypothetical protein